MEYEVILEKGDYALIKRGKQLREYAVVNGLNKDRGDWDFTCCYYGICSNHTEAQALALALEGFRMRTEPGYIPRLRLEELVTQLKDGLMEDDREEALLYFDEVCGMTEEEKIWLGIEAETEDCL